MVKAILGKKIGMTQVFDSEGNTVPVTVIQAGPCVVTQKKTAEVDGYNAIQIGFLDVKEERINKPLKGHFAKAGVSPKKVLREFETEDMEGIEVGQEIKMDVFSEGDKVRVTGISKGKGFAGAIKRWGFSGGPASHGSSLFHRRPASSGPTEPSHVFKGTKKPGHMGFQRVTVQGLEVMKVKPEKNLLVVKGSVPGASGSILAISEDTRKK